MAKSSLLGGEPVPEIPEGRTIARLGPSNSSDSGSDSAGLTDDDSDAAGTGERASAEEPREEVAGDADILPDRVISPAGADRPPLDAREARQLAQEQARSIDA